MQERKYKSMVVTSESIALSKRKMEFSQQSDNFEPSEDLSESDKA